MKTWGGMEAKPHAFLISTLYGDKRLASCPAASPQEKKFRYLLNMRQGEPKSRYGGCGEKINPLPLPGIES
jgi:hypothetical protein